MFMLCISLEIRIPLTMVLLLCNIMFIRRKNLLHIGMSNIQKYKLAMSDYKE